MINKNENKKRANKILNYIDYCTNNNISIDIPDSQLELLDSISKNGYIDTFFRNAEVDFVEYSPQLKKVYYSSIKNWRGRSSSNDSSSTSLDNDTSTSNSYSDDVTSKNNDDTLVTSSYSDDTTSNNDDDTLVTNSYSDSSTSNTFVGETEEEKKRYNNNLAMMKKLSAIRSVMRSNLNKLNQYQILNCTFSTNQKYRTTDIKEFYKRLSTYFKKLGDKLKDVTVTHKEDNAEVRTYTYEHFSVISVVSCTLLGYLHCHCILVFEGCITKIAPVKSAFGGTGFNFKDNVIQKLWKYGNVHIQHYLGGLTQEHIDNIIEYFCRNYVAIRNLKSMNDEELRERAEKNVNKYIDKKYDIDMAEIDPMDNKDEDIASKRPELIEECYANLKALKEQQADGKRNKLFFHKKCVQEEDLTVSMRYKDVAQYTRNMAVVEQDIKFRVIRIADVLKMQISFAELYENYDNENGYRNYDNSVNVLSKAYYREMQKSRRCPVEVPPTLPTPPPVTLIQSTNTTDTNDMDYEEDIEYLKTLPFDLFDDDEYEDIIEDNSNAPDTNTNDEDYEEYIAYLKAEPFDLFDDEYEDIIEDNSNALDTNDIDDDYDEDDDLPEALFI